MKVILLTDKSTAHKGKVMVNTDSITLVRQTYNTFGDEYAELYLGENKIEVEESYVKVITLLKKAGVIDSKIIEKEE
jgi:hypothetical protein